MFRRRSIAAAPGFVFGVGPFFDDVKEFLMDFGLAGESLGIWKGAILTLSALLVIWAFWPDAKKLSKKLFGKKQSSKLETASSNVDYITAGAIIDRYIAPAMVDANSGVKISVRKQFIDAFSKTTGAMVGPYEYNGVLLRNWLESNAARFLVENVGDMQ